MKIFTSKKDKDCIIRSLLAGFSRSLTDVKVRLMEEFKDQVPATTSFTLGYFAGRQTQKYWLYTEQDLEAMYTNCTSTDIMMWCDGRNDDSEGPRSKKRKTGEGFQSKREEKEHVPVVRTERI